MKNKYYDTNKFRRILANLENNPLLAKKELEEYIIEFNQDYSARLYYAYVLIIFGEFEKAENELDYLEFEIVNVKSIGGNIEKIIKNRKDLIITKLNLLSRQERYEELYEYYQQHYKEIKSTEEENEPISPLMFYCRKKIGLINSERREKHSYLFRQIVDYQENDFFEHVQKHLAEPNTHLDEPNPCIFNQDFPINDIIKEIKRIIPSPLDNRLYYNFYVTIYVFNYNDCGKVNGESVDYFKVVCFQNTSDIITMYPDTNCRLLPHTDLNYIIKDYNDTKVKTLRRSQIDKFNKRYGLK